jgi:hypothetical protein
METVLSAIVILFWMLVVPMGIGILPAGCLPACRRTVPITYISGMLLSWTVFGLTAVPCMLLITYGAFKYCVTIYIWLEMILFLAGIIFGAINIRRSRYAHTMALELKGKFSFRMLGHFFEGVFPGELHAAAEDYMNPRSDVYDKKQRYSFEGKILWAVFFLLMGFQLYMAATRSSFDGDDAYYVVESVLSQQTDTMNTILPYTGGTTTLDVRHALAVITMWVAFIAKVSGVHATIISHTVLPLFLIPLTYLIFIQIARLILARKPDLRPVFMIILAVFVMFGHTSISTAETFFLTRTWQGKSMLANIAIPLLIWLLLWIAEDENRRKFRKISRLEIFSPWMLICLTNIAAGFFTSMGVMLCTGLIFAACLVMAVGYRKPSLFLCALLVCIPNYIYALVYKMLALHPIL